MFTLLFTLTLLVSCSLCSGYYCRYSSEELSSEESTSGELHCQGGTPASYAQKLRIAEFKNSETPPDCPPGESMMSKKDIFVMINHLQSKFHIIRNINDSYIPVAVTVRNKHLQSIKELEKRLQTRTENLKDIIADIDATQTKLEPIVDALVSKLQQYNTSEDQFEKVNDLAQKVLEPMEKYKQLCNFNNCDERKLVKRQNNLQLIQTVTDEDYYCTSLEDLHERILTNLTTFQNNYIEVIKHRLNNDDSMYAEKIDSIRSNLKESALALFGPTMYDILSLQDDYHRYAIDLNTMAGITTEFNTIRKNTLGVDLKLIELEEGLAKYHQYCLTCKPQVKSRKALPLNYWYPFQKPEKQLKPSGMSPSLLKATNEPNSEDIMNSLNIDVLIENKTNDYKHTIDNGYVNMFEELEKVVNDSMLIDSYIEKLKPIQEDISKELVLRQEALNILKSKLPESMIEQVCELSTKSVQLFETVRSAIDFVHKYV